MSILVLISKKKDQNSIGSGNYNDSQIKHRVLDDEFAIRSKKYIRNVVIPQKMNDCGLVIARSKNTSNWYTDNYICGKCLDCKSFKEMFQCNHKSKKGGRDQNSIKEEEIKHVLID